MIKQLMITTLFVAAFPIMAASVTDKASDKAQATQAYDLYMIATEGDERAVTDAQALLKPLHPAYANDPIVRAIEGGLLTLQGRAAYLPWNKLSYTNDGLAILAQANEGLTPDHDTLEFAGLPATLQVKAIVGVSFIKVPSFFGRFDQGYEILKQAMGLDLLDDLSPQQKSFLYYYTALAAKQAGDAEYQQALVTELMSFGIEDEFTQAALTL